MPDKLLDEFEGNWQAERPKVLASIIIIQKDIASINSQMIDIKNNLTTTLHDIQDSNHAIQQNCAVQMARNVQIQKDIDNNRISVAEALRTTRSIPSNLDARLQELEKLAPVTKVVLWIGAALGVSIIGLIWGLLTGTVQLFIQ